MTRAAGPTLEDVAGAAGVSLATASRCLNNPESVRAEKRARILAAVAQLDYVPHGAARALASRRTKMLGAVLPFATLPPERRVVGVDLPLSAMPEGDFVVELVASRGETSERRLLAFRVVR